jgi:hypothetical protein
MVVDRFWADARTLGETSPNGQLQSAVVSWLASARGRPRIFRNRKPKGSIIELHRRKTLLDAG